MVGSKVEVRFFSPLRHSERDCLALTCISRIALFVTAGRGAFAGSHHRDLPDAPRGPASTRAGRQAKESTHGTPAPSDKARPAKEQREEKKTLTDFKIVGLEVPELDWRWGVVHGQDREEEVEGSGGRKRKAEVGNEGQFRFIFLPRYVVSPSDKYI